MVSDIRPIGILDFGSQTGHLFARRVRDLGYASEVAPCGTPAAKIRHWAGIVLSGGAASVYDPKNPTADLEIFNLGVPILGLCYGLHWVVQLLGGRVCQGEKREYGPVMVRRGEREHFLFRDCPDEWQVWMSHGDVAVDIPPDFEAIATSDNCRYAALECAQRRAVLLQWHPEHAHTQFGKQLIRRFCEYCQASSWSVADRLAQLRREIATQVGERRVIAFVSGGVDSTVMFTLLNEAVAPDRVAGLMIDNGLLRAGEVRQVWEAFRTRGCDNLRVVDDELTVLRRLRGVYDPQVKRQLIGDRFIQLAREQFGQHSCFLDGQTLLAQGTIYPDTVETGPIKMHHNRSPLAEEWVERGLITEPLKDFYKDEIRELGRQLGLPAGIVGRHPFPGPGLAVRVLCAQQPHWPERVPAFRETRVQPLPVKSVGAKGDHRSYEYALALFADEPCRFPEYFWELASAVPNTTPGYNRVVVCASHAYPPTLVFTPGDLSARRLDLLRRADEIVTKAMQEAGLYDAIWQCPVVLLPFGVRSGTESIVLRPVESEDAMTAVPYRLLPRFLERVAEQLLVLRGISMVFYDLTTKPPGTIEWE